MLGDCYGAEFFRDIKNTKIKSALQRISSESQEDLENYSNVLKDFGCKVLRPELDVDDSIMNYVDKDGHYRRIGSYNCVNRAPLNPRDTQLVIGNNLLYTGTDHPAIRSCLDAYDTKDAMQIDGPMKLESYNGYKGEGAPDWPSYLEFVDKFSKNEPYSTIADIHQEIADLVEKEKVCYFPIPAPCITVVGKDIYVDVYGVGKLPPTFYTELATSEIITEAEYNKSYMETVSHTWLNYYLDTLTSLFPNFRINYLNIGGHSDGCFHTLKPGAILSLREIQTYEDTFPEWDICYLPDQSWTKIDAFVQLKKQNSGKWWVPGQEDNAEFTNFVETWLQDWVGYVEETVFDVNVVMLDENHCCISQPDNEQVNNFLKKHKIEPIYVPWRHRYFWDGGLHCITLDLQRSGTQQDYFPTRQQAIADKGF